MLSCQKVSCKYMTFIAGFFQLAFVIFDGTKSLLDEQGNVWKGRKRNGLYGHCQAAKKPAAFESQNYFSLEMHLPCFTPVFTPAVTSEVTPGILILLSFVMLKGPLPTEQHSELG